jgi:hypothetical protein
MPDSFEIDRISDAPTSGSSESEPQLLETIAPVETTELVATETLATVPVVTEPAPKGPNPFKALGLAPELVAAVND